MKFYLTGVTTNHEYENLRDLIEPIKHQFDGLIWTFHDPIPNDEGYQYLQKNVGCGKIISSEWVRRLDYSRNKTLFEGPMQEGDWFMVIDDKERIAPEFVEWLKNATSTEQFTGYAFEGKRLFYKYTEFMFYRGNPHEGLHSLGPIRNFLKTEVPENSFSNVRDQQRDEFHWVGHYFKYYFFPASNHVLLGYETNPTYVEERMKIRQTLKEMMIQKGFQFSSEGFFQFYEKYYDDPDLKKIMNSEKILNDWYWLTIKGDTKLYDIHDYKIIKEIP